MKTDRLWFLFVSNREVKKNEELEKLDPRSLIFAFNGWLLVYLAEVSKGGC